MKLIAGLWKLNISKGISFIILFSLLSSFAIAQSIKVSTLGLDDRLYNGRYYTYFPPKEVRGNQFLIEKLFSNATVWINGAEFNNLQLNYDVFNQEVLLAFETQEAAKRVIMLSKAHIDSFYFDNKKFIIEKLGKDDYAIFQRIKVGELELNIYWSKRLELQTSLNNIQYFFTNPQRGIYIIKSQNKTPIRNNRSLYKLFQKKQASSLRKYMRSNKLKLPKMNDSQYFNLLVFISKLPNA